MTTHADHPAQPAAAAATACLAAYPACATPRAPCTATAHAQEP